MIPRKLFDRLSTSLTYFRTHPGPDTDRWLLADETETDWPRAASAEQLAEWQAICDRTRPTFETEVRALRARQP